MTRLPSNLRYRDTGREFREVVRQDTWDDTTPRAPGMADLRMMVRLLPAVVVGMFAGWLSAPYVAAWLSGFQS